MGAVKATASSGRDHALVVRWAGAVGVIVARQDRRCETVRVPYIRTIRALIAEKEAEIARLGAELSAARAYVRLLRNRLKAAEKRLEGSPEETDDPIVTVRRAILEAGQPVFVDDLLAVLGQPLTRDSREQLRRLLLPWVRRGEVFTRPRPSMFGLVEKETRR
ncbi:MAG: hypothetical protein ABI779_13385 [Acidobacteriota bacterium]